MRCLIRIRYVLLASIMLFLCACPVVIPDEPVHTYTYDIVNTFPHDSYAFTQGLVFHDGSLYEGTGLRGRSSLRKVHLVSGSTLQSHILSGQYFGEGITIFDDKIIQLTWEAQKGFVYDLVTFRPLQEFTYPTEGWGITHDGTNLIMSDGTSTLHFLDPETFEEVDTIEVLDEGVPVRNLNELEYINGEIYANIWLDDFIARISPDTGKVAGWIDLTGILQNDAGADVLNGIAYDAEGDRLFVTGKLWPKLFEITLRRTDDD